MKKNTLILNLTLLAAVGTLTQCGDMPSGGYGGYGDNNRYGGYNNNNNDEGISVSSTSNGYFVTFSGEKKNAVYNKSGRLEKQANCSDYDLNRAQRAVDAKMRSEQPGRHSSSSPPSVKRKPDGKMEVRMHDGGTLMYNKNGRLISKSKTVSSSDQQHADQAVRTFMRN